jgi:hypothetical protein
MAPQLMATNGLVAAGREPVELARDELLARAGLAEHEDGQVRGRDPAEDAEHGLHRRLVPIISPWEAACSCDRRFLLSTRSWLSCSAWNTTSRLRRVHLEQRQIALGEQVR